MMSQPKADPLFLEAAALRWKLEAWGSCTIAENAKLDVILFGE
jgi:hypothetical protein